MSKQTTIQAKQISKADYEALANFRYSLRRFLHFTEEGAREAGLTPQQHQVLLALKGQPGKEWAYVAEIAEALQIKHHAAVMLIDRCEKAELVTRTVDPNDRRQVRVSLLAQGEELLAVLSEKNLSELRKLRQVLQLEFLSEDAEEA